MENLSLQYFRGQNFSFRINRGISAFSILEVLKYPDDFIFDFDVFLPSIGLNLQRPLVWTLFQKQQLIISILKGVKLPTMTFIQYSDGVSIDRKRIYKVIDGKQRLTTLLDFANNKFPLSINSDELFFNELPEDCRRELLCYWVTVDIGYEYSDESISDSEKIRWFELINFSGTPQDEQHLKNLKAAFLA